MRKFSIFILSITIMIPVFSVISLAYETPECDYGMFDAWYSKDGVGWQNTTVDYAELKRGEPFYIKATVSTKIDSAWVSIRLWETGVGSAEKSSFEVIDGPSNTYQAFDLSEIPEKNTSFTYTWKIRVKPDTDWVGGNAPLNIRAQFDKKVNGEWHSDDISFTAVNVYILDELWEGYTDNNGNSNNSDNGTNGAPGFELIVVITALALFLMWKRKNE